MGYRIMQKFWLDLDKPDHEEVNEIIFTFKNARTYSKAIRDGLRLVHDLRAGHLDVLFELFPWVRAEFLEYMSSVQPQKSETETNIQKQLARIEELLASTETTSGGAGGPKAMTIPAMDGSIPEESEVTLTIKKAKSPGNSAQNFLDAAFGLVQ